MPRNTHLQSQVVNFAVSTGRKGRFLKSCQFWVEFVVTCRFWWHKELHKILVFSCSSHAVVSSAFFLYYFLRDFPFLASWFQLHWHCWWFVIEQLLYFQCSCCHAEMGTGILSACPTVTSNLWLNHFNFCTQECAILGSQGKHFGAVPSSQSEGQERRVRGRIFVSVALQEQHRTLVFAFTAFQRIRSFHLPQNCFFSWASGGLQQHACTFG